MQSFDLIIIGGGPAGYVGAIRASQLGLKTALIEKHQLGGMCLNWGCMPSKSFIETARLFDRMSRAETFGIEGFDKKALSVNWKKALARKDRIVTRLVRGVEFLMKKNNVQVISGEAKIIDAGHVSVGGAEYLANRLLIATGSRPERPGYAGIPPEKIREIDEFFALEEIPNSFLIDGGRINACELAQMLRMIGKKVTMVTMHDTLVPFMDGAVCDFITDKFKKMGITVYTKSEITKDAPDGVYAGDNFIECQMIINARQRVPILPELGQLKLDLEEGHIKVDEYMQTSQPNVYAAGDCAGQYFAQIASAMATTAVNHMAGIKVQLDLSRLPMNMYTDPEIATVGLTEEKLKQKGIEYQVGVFPLSVNGKAMIEGYTEGFVKVLSEKRYGEVLGVHIVAPNATDMIAEAVMAMQMESTLEDVGRVVHAHPTISETFLEASFVADEKPVHI